MFLDCIQYLLFCSSHPSKYCTSSSLLSFNDPVRIGSFYLDLNGNCLCKLLSINDKKTFKQRFCDYQKKINLFSEIKQDFLE